LLRQTALELHTQRSGQGVQTLTTLSMAMQDIWHHKNPG
jgi:hypothetical protein